jgi:hypothetical protein
MPWLKLVQALPYYNQRTLQYLIKALSLKHYNALNKAFSITKHYIALITALVREHYKRIRISDSPEPSKGHLKSKRERRAVLASN